MTPPADRAWFAAFLDLRGRLAVVGGASPVVAARRAFWERVVDGPVGRMALEGRDAEARALLESELQPPAEG